MNFPFYMGKQFAFCVNDHNEETIYVNRDNSYRYHGIYGIKISRFPFAWLDYTYTFKWIHVIHLLIFFRVGSLAFWESQFQLSNFEGYG